MTEKPDEKKMERKPYRKPEIEEVELVAEEAVLTICKQPASGGEPRCVDSGGLTRLPGS